ncbi:YiiX/YebB-like N1pC/P60 family cysteine hydrolase, partial [Planctomycetota bacterium]
AAYIRKERPRLWSDFKEEKVIIESIAAGVVLNTMMKSAAADYVGAMRARISRKDKFLALMTAFSHYGKPYDYNFDFVTDSAMVCTELVYKSFLGGEHKQGVVFPLTKHAGRDLCTAQQMVEAFDLGYEPEDKRQLDFVAFVDYDEEKSKVYFADLKTFRASAARPKWSILLE